MSERPSAPAPGRAASPARPAPSRGEGESAAATAPVDRAGLERRIGEALLRDRRVLRQRLARLRRGDRPALRRLEAAIARSCAARAARADRAARLPASDLPPDLPITAQRLGIAAAVERHPVVVVRGETGSGKTTQLPKICLAAGRGAAGWIGHTQPRRIAARSVAARIARELGGRVGEAVGSKVRFQDEVGPDTCVKVMTDGILVAEIGKDRLLEAYDTLIIDEAHERSLNIDLLLGHVKGLLAHRPDLRVIVSSATLDTGRIADFFGGAPVIDVSGRAHPVEVRYAEAGSAPEDPVAAVPEAVRSLAGEGPGDVLVFLPGERDIREAARALRADRGFEALPLYARLNHAQQERIFRPGERRRVVLATNVAETSITVPRIRFVVDTGLARISRYSYRTKVQRLPVEPVSRASAEQRRGRCGRVGPGVCVRLYSREDFEGRPRFTAPEVRRTNLASVILRMAASGLGRVDEFAFIDPPDRRFVADGYRLLRELGAFDAQDRVTGIGRRLARLPVDPRIGRMILAAGALGCVAEILVIAAALSAGDPRGSPPEGEGGGPASAAHRRFTDPRSDFMGYLSLWRLLNEAGRPRSDAGFRRRCEQLSLSPRRVREWADVHRQLLVAAREMGLKPAPRPATYAQIHRAVLAGCVAHVGVRTQGREYRGPRDRTFVLSRASSVKPAGVHWIVAADLVETSAVFAHVAARVRPQWIERAARGLVTREYFEPHFDPERGEVMALERVVLHGLTVVPRRRVRFAPVDPAGARAIFVSEGLVAGGLVTGAGFERRNRAMVERVREIERRTRRQDVLVGEETRAGFFEARLPPDVASERALRRWLDSAPEGSERLCFALDDLVRPGARLPAEGDFPDEIEVSGVPVPLAYRFAPGAPDDGVTARVPLAVLGTVEAERFEWLVPGYREEKAAALLRTLPRPVRRRIAPLGDTARRCLARLGPPPGEGSEGFAGSLAAALREVRGVEAEAARLRPDLLPPHLHMRFEVIGPEGRALGSGRDLDALKRRFRAAAARGFERAAERTFEREGLTSWCFGDLAPHVDGVYAGVRFRGYPALEDRGASVALRLFEAPRRAASVHPAGVLRLAMLGLGRELRSVRRALGRTERLALRYLRVPAAPWFGAGEPALPVPEAPGGAGGTGEFGGAGESGGSVGEGGGFAAGSGPTTAPAPAPAGTPALAVAPAPASPANAPAAPASLHAADLEGELLRRAVLDCCLADGQGDGSGAAAVRTRAEFERRLAAGAPRLGPAATALRDLAERIIAAWEAVRAARAGLDGRTYPESLADFDEHLAWLVHRGFVADTPTARLEEVPRYLEAAGRRLEKLPRNPARDLEAVRVQRRSWEPVRDELLGYLRAGEPPDPARMDCRWMLEELRVSLFAQELGTPRPVSVQRVERAWAARPPSPYAAPAARPWSRRTTTPSSSGFGQG